MLTLLFTFLPLLAFAEGIAVIIHPDNKDQSFSQRELREIFLKRNRYWKNHQLIKCYLPERRLNSFQKTLEYLVETDYTRWTLHWERMRNLNAIHPPRYASDEIYILKKITKDINAIGVVSLELLKGKIREKVRIVYQKKY